jgi:hypothetical protein
MLQHVAETNSPKASGKSVAVTEVAEVMKYPYVRVA